MSRIGKKAISIPPKVKVNLTSNGDVSVEGPKGILQWVLPRLVNANIEGDYISISTDAESRESKALHGLSRAILANMVAGVTSGFKKDMEIHGVGFKAAVQGAKLNLSLGKSHPIIFDIPAGIKITVSENTKISIEGIDKQLVGQCAADIRAFYPPEPYKGKGVRFVGEQIRRKEGKTITIIMATINKRKLRHTRLRKKISGTPERPRLAVHFSERHITAQIIDDLAGKTIVSVNTMESELRSKSSTQSNVATAEKVGKLIAERGTAKKITKVVFDRGGFKYHGKVKALADAARDGGFQF